MAAILVTRFYEIPEESSFILVGSVKGSVCATNVIRIPAGKVIAHSMINRVEVRDTEVEIHLTTSAASAETLRNLPVVGKTFEIETLENARYRHFTARFFRRAQRLGDNPPRTRRM